MGGNGVAMGYDQLSTRCRPASSTAPRTTSRATCPTSTTSYAKFYTLDRAPDHPRDPGVLEEDWDTLSKDDQALIMKFGKEAQQEQRKLWESLREAGAWTR